MFGCDGGGPAYACGAVFGCDGPATYGAGTGWVTLADPEGNLFCVLRSEGEL